MGSIYFGLVFGLLVSVFLYTPGPGRRLRHWLVYRMMMRRLWQRGQAVVALRVVDGSHGGLGSKWHSGTVVMTPGRLEFTRFVGGMSFLKRPAIMVPVVSVGAVGRLSGLGRWRLDPDCEVVRLTTPSGVVEMAVLPPIPAERVLARMR